MTHRAARALRVAGAGLASSALLVAIGLPAAPASAVTSPPVVAYGLDEASGTAVADASGNGRSGVAQGVTWSAGRYGGGAGFNGTSSRVTSSAAIPLGATFTLMAWVLNPAASGYETVLTVGSSRDLYLQNGLVSFHDGSSDRSLGASLPAGRWVHLAVSYDGSALRAFVDSAAAGSAVTASLPATSAALQVGAWPSGGGSTDFFSGTIDEVQVFPTALTASEIATAAGTPAGSGGSGGGTPDTTPPVRSGAQPSGSLPAGTTQATLRVTTSEAATCRYGTTPGTAYGSLPQAFATTGGTDHASPLTGLADGGSYSYVVRCRDTASNANTDDLAVSFTVASAPSGSGRSLRFFGNGSGGIDRVRIPLTPSRSINVGGDLTIEWWMKTTGPLVSDSCSTGNDAWIYGNILIDRDVFGNGDYGDYGVSLFGNGGGTIAFGVSRGSSGATACSTVGVADGQWHHVAVTRSSSSGLLSIYVDGQARGTRSGPTGNIAYRDGRGGAANDPYLVLGAEKHDAGSQFPSYPGWMDELRISSTLRYTASFSPAEVPARDAATVALYHFDEGSGTTAGDTTGANPGTLMVGGSPVGPQWSTDVP